MQWPSSSLSQKGAPAPPRCLTFAGSGARTASRPTFIHTSVGFLRNATPRMIPPGTRIGISPMQTSLKPKSNFGAKNLHLIRPPAPPPAYTPRPHLPNVHTPKSLPPTSKPPPTTRITDKNSSRRSAVIPDRRMSSTPPMPHSFKPSKEKSPKISARQKLLAQKSAERHKKYGTQMGTMHGQLEDLPGTPVRPGTG